MKDKPYKTVIEEGQDARNDQKHAFLLRRLWELEPERWLDIGCNTGWLLEEFPGGEGVDASLAMVERAKAKGLAVHHADAENLPFAADAFEVAVLGSMLHLVRDWRPVIAEASRVATLVIGTAEYPGTPWGTVGGVRKSVKSVIDPAEIEAMGGTVERINDYSYFFAL